MSALERIGEGLVSFGTGIPRVELEARRLANEQREVNLEATQNDLEAQRRNAQRELEMERLRQTAFGGGPDADAALQQIFAMNPEMGSQVFEGLGARDQAAREEASRDAARIRAVPFAQRRPLILERAARLEALGRDASDTLSLLDMDEQSQNNALRVIEMAALTAQQRLNVERGAGLSSEGRTFNSQVDELTRLEAIPEGERTPAEKTRMDALNIRLGRTPRAGTSVDERLAANPDLAESVIDVRADSAGAVAGAKTRERNIENRLEAVSDLTLAIDDNNRSLQRALDALAEGANTGSVISRMGPSFTDATLKLEQVRNELGLDVIGSVTFGALSEGELTLAMQTALPTNLSEPELKQWIEDRIAAQNKLRDYYMDQIDWLSGGGTIAEFLQSKEDDDDDDEPGRIGRFEVTVED